MWSEIAEAFHRDGVVRFRSGLTMDVRMPIEWPRPFPQVTRLRIVRDLFHFIASLSTAGFGFRPIGALQTTELAASEAVLREALTKYAIEAVSELAPSDQTDWIFGAILVGATQFVAKVEADARLVIARSGDDRGTPPEVLDLLAKFIAIDREACQKEALCLEALAAEGDRAPSSIQ